MIAHSIERYTPSTVVLLKEGKSTKFQGQHGSADHKEFIFWRALGQFKFKTGDIVVYHKKPAFITDIYGEYGPHIEWTGLKPRFVEILCQGEIFIVHPSMLRRKR